jgi:selenophosphate synthetase-related protein
MLLDKDFQQLYLQLRSSPAEVSGLILRVRDLTTFSFSKAFRLVVSCDSDGGIGPKEHDLVKVPGKVLGRFAARVPLMEMLASGAVPIVVVNTLSVEMEPTGKNIIEGVREETSLAGLDADKAVTGSTEDNVPTVATGVGVVVLGLVAESDLRPGTSLAGDLVVCIGLPKSAPDDDVRLDDPEIADTACVRVLAAQTYLHDILPVGSKGVVFEQNELARCAGLKVDPVPNSAIDIHKSGGPSTCVLVSVPPEKIDELRSRVHQPVNIIGKLIAG